MENVTIIYTKIPNDTKSLSINLITSARRIVNMGYEIFFQNAFFIIANSQMNTKFKTIFGYFTFQRLMFI